MEQLLKLQKECAHPPKSKQMLKAHKCRWCGNVYTLLRCMICSQWFSHCKVCTNDKLMPWE